MSPAAASWTNVETAGGIKHYLVGIPAIHHIFEKGINQYGEIW